MCGYPSQGALLSKDYLWVQLFFIRRHSAYKSVYAECLQPHNSAQIVVKGAESIQLSWKAYVPLG